MKGLKTEDPHWHQKLQSPSLGDGMALLVKANPRVEEELVLCPSLERGREMHTPLKTSLQYYIMKVSSLSLSRMRDF